MSVTTGPRVLIQRIDWLDYVRFTCALGVMLGHYFIITPQPMVSPEITGFGPAADITKYAAVGLYIFLMMSGMLVTLVAQRESAGIFVAHRFARIYPIFLLCMTVSALVSQIGVPRLAVSFPQYLANLAIAAPVFGHRYVETVYWTMVIEIVFYLAMAVVIATGAIRRLQTIAIVWVLLQLLAIPLPKWLPLLGRDYSFIAAGMVFALLYQRRNQLLNLGLLLVSLALCTRAAIAYSSNFGAQPYVAAAITIFTFALFLAMRGRNPSLPFARRLGSMTYPLYLLHFGIGMAIFHHSITESNKWTLVFATSLGMIGIAFAIDDIMEFRLRKLWLRIAKAPIAWWDNRQPRELAG